MKPNTSKLRNLLDDFLYNANPKTKASEDICTVGDLRKALAQFEIFVEGFINELDKTK